MSVTRRDALRLAALGAAGLLLPGALGGCDRGQDAEDLVLDPNRLDPFTRDSGSGSSTGLPARVGWASTADSEFFNALGRGMRAAATERGLDYLTAVSGNDPAKHVADMEGFLTKGVGAFAMQPLVPAADTPVLRRAIDAGVCAQGIITGPSTLQVVAGQYQIGYDQGKAAADYVKAHLGGEAKALYFNLDTVSPQLQLRHRGVLDGLKTAGGGIEVVGDITVAEISTRSGFNTMRSALEAHDDIKVVMGGDTIVVGAYNALKDAGKLRDDMFLAGVDGDSDALALIRQGGAYKLSIGFAWALMGYGLGAFGADWIAGKRIPRMLVANGISLDSASAVDAFLQANADPAAVFADEQAYARYLPALGSVSHSDRKAFWTKPVDVPSPRAS